MLEPTRYLILTSLIAVLFGCPSLLGQSRPLAGTGKKSIGTDFRITSDFFAINMKKDLARLESDFSDELTQLGNENMTFLDWKNANHPQLQRQVSTILIVYLEGRTSGIGEETWLRVEGQKGGQVYRFDDQLVVSLYSPYQDPPVKTEALRRDVRTRLQEIFHPGAKRDRLMNDFLRYVPVSNQAMVLEKYEKLVIPLPEKDLAVAAGSELSLSLDSQRGIARFKLALTEAKVGDEKLREQIQCTVSSFVFDKINDNHWRKEIPLVFKSFVPDSLAVFMDHYVRLPYHCTQAGRVICTERDL